MQKGGAADILLSKLEQPSGLCMFGGKTLTSIQVDRLEWRRGTAKVCQRGLRSVNVCVCFREV